MSRASITIDHTFLLLDKSFDYNPSPLDNVDICKPSDWCGTLARPRPLPDSLASSTKKTPSTLVRSSPALTMAAQRALRVSSPKKHEQKLQALKIAGDKAPATLTETDLKKALPEKAPDTPSSKTASYTCITELAPPESSPAAIMVGLFKQIPRWKYGSVINFATYSEGFPAPGDAIYAANCLIEAAEVWTSANIGVKFKWMSNIEDAAFALAYGGEKGTVLASAFFPNDSALETLYVYQYGFDKTERPGKNGNFTNYEIMKNVFLHELGHVLGLRHEFAMDPGDTFEGGAYRIGSANPESVMSYVFPPEMQESDIRDARYFYKHPQIVDYSPDN